jgi:diaminopimelate decarboxylase
MINRYLETTEHLQTGIWGQRIELKTMSRVLGCAVMEGLLNHETKAVIFHDLDRVRLRVGELHDRFPASTLHAVAIKANPLVDLLRVLVDAGAGLEAASIEEVELACAAGCPPKRIVYNSPAKTLPELKHALTIGVCINADNLDEIQRIAEVRALAPSASDICLRINPLVGKGTIASTSVAGRGSKFGVSIDKVEEITSAFATHPWLGGLHVHVGSQGCQLELLTAGAVRAVQLRTELHDRLGRLQIRMVNIGGGLPAAYREGETPPSLSEYVAALRAQAPALFADTVQLVTEFGRAIHATAGWAASRVEYVKDSGGDRLAVIHLGADFLLRRVYAPADWHHELAVLNAMGQPKLGPLEPWTIVGPLCFAGDVLAQGVLLPTILPGDFIVVRDTGAYTLSMWSRHCSRGLPLVLGYDSNSLCVLKAQETPADVVSFWSRGSS